ncbi:Lrp/AsnC family transcriptional regulator [Anaeroselena agilis]|uniref:Lrp/AsnC family transcriptional regulator n=1 Tax=Anaeroselena agilis TaxID=3063788 RepID=A0ABU3NWK8_9FIRM|nr:Lrp/AsnC family transcriptional regulator [Selenomonadales bacterium 4137-cl]
MLDDTDLAIIRLLRENSRLQWKEIGAAVHLTGQAVAARVRALEEAGVITGYSAGVDAAKIGQPLTAFVTVFMASADHAAFHRFLENEQSITAAHRVSGDGCYWLRADLASHDELNALLQKILRHGNYRLHLSIGRIK